MRCSDCPNQCICEAQNKVDMGKIQDITIALDGFDWKLVKELLNKYKAMLVNRNLRITGRDEE